MFSEKTFMIKINHDGTQWGDVSQVSAGASGGDSLTSTKPRLPSTLREMCPFTASQAFQWATLAVAPLFFQTGSSELALMAGNLQAHISICQPDGPLRIVICWILHLLFQRKSNQSRMRSVCCSKQRENFYLVVLYKDRLWSTSKLSHGNKPIAKSIITVAKNSMHMLVSQKPLEKINFPHRETLTRMSSITHSHWAICNSHFSFEGSWELNREEFPFEGRICWNRPMIISILMVL